MKNSKIVRDALSSLTDTERKLFSLLTGKETVKEDVTGFLACYDIDRETAVSSFLINVLLDRFRIEETEDPCIPRIRGLAQFFRFQNATAVMRQKADEAVTDTELYLKLRFPDEIRPFSASRVFLNRSGLVRITGRRYADRMLSKTSPVKLQQKAFLIPGDSFLPDIIFIGLYRSLWYDGNRDSVICYLYDLYRYSPDGRPGIGLAFSVRKMKIRHCAGRIKRWLLRSGH